MDSVKKIIVFCVLISSIIFGAVCLFFKSEDRIVFSVDNFTLSKDNITIGRNSDVCFNKIPQDYLKISFENNAVKWEVNPKYLEMDSLYYLKINNENPNMYKLATSDRIVITTENGEEQLTVEEIEKLLEGQENEYVMLGHLFAKKHFEEDSVVDFDFLGSRTCHSFIYRKKESFPKCGNESPQLIILDTNTKLYQFGGDIRSYCMSGEVKEGAIKVQFFKMTSSAYRLKEVEKEQFFIGDINYVAKPAVITTEWGAGHILAKQENKEDELVVKVYFPKPITYVERIDELEKAKNESSGMLTYCQNDGSFPLNNRLVVPKFSEQASLYLGSLMFAGDTVLFNNSVLRSDVRFIPHFDDRISGERNDVGVRVGYIDNNFMWSCLLLPFIFWLVLMILYVIAIKVSLKKSDDACDAAKSAPLYTSIIMLILLAFAMFRIMIAVKLAYTYPYFEKVFAINTMSVCLIFLLATGLSVLINLNFFKPLAKKGICIPIFYLIVIIVAALLLYFCGKNYSSMWSSYLPGEIGGFGGSWNLWKWRNMDGMNDLLLNVPYTLFVVNALVCVLLFLLLLKPINKIIIIIKEKITIIKEKITKKIEAINKPIITYLVKYVILPALVILIISLFPGNFTTAIITFLEILFLTRAIKNIDFKKCRNNLWSLLLLMIVCGIYFLVALPADPGYIINLLGIYFFACCVFFISNKNYNDNDKLSKKMKGVIKFIPALLLVVVVVLVAVAQCSGGSGVSEVDYDRSSRRFAMTSRWSEYTNSGYRYAESDGEFMRVMVHYMHKNGGDDPLSNDDNILHSSISQGQSPVILNDVAVPSSFFGAYGTWAHILLGLLLACMACVVMMDTIQLSDKTKPVGKWALRRLLAMFMWVGSSLYLYISYYGYIPFTGRLMPGMGVDSVGEALECSVLVAFMLSCNLIQEKDEEKSNKEGNSDS